MCHSAYGVDRGQLLGAEPPSLPWDSGVKLRWVLRLSSKQGYLLCHLTYFKNLTFFICVCVFACIYACVPDVHLVPAEEECAGTL